LQGRGICATLPLAAPAGDAAARVTDERVALPKKRALLVDDRDAAHRLAMLLKFIGADAQVAYPGFEALEVL
jgi:hypothetical protein